jgi:hypothetical protein
MCLLSIEIYNNLKKESTLPAIFLLKNVKPSRLQFSGICAASATAGAVAVLPS